MPNAHTVLVVDDDEHIRKLVSSALQSAGFTVLVASHGQMAMQVADSYTGVIDVLLTDVIMPGITGPLLALTLKASRPHLKILLMSGHTAGLFVDGYGWPLIQKPFRTVEVIGQLRAVLGEPQRPVPEA